MLVDFFRLDCYVIEVVLKAPMHHIVKNDSHGTPIGCACILQAKGHECVVEITYGCSESSILGVRGVHLDLVVVTESVH